MYRTISLFAMISGVFFVLLGEAALLGSPPVLVWFLIVFAVNAVYRRVSGLQAKRPLLDPSSKTVDPGVWQALLNAIL